MTYLPPEFEYILNLDTYSIAINNIIIAGNKEIQP